MLERLISRRHRGGLVSLALARAEQAAAIKVALVLAPLAAIAALLVVLLVFLAGGAGGGCAPGGDSGQTVGQADVSKLGARLIPARFLPIYVDAAQRYQLGPRGWSMLASIHKNENGFSGSGGSPTSTAGALGPMQFIPSTWQRYAADGDGDGQKDVQNVHDAIFGAARYLRALGAPGDWRTAIFGYNHADWYVALITDWASRLAGGSATQLVSTTTGGGGACGCPSTQPAGAPGPGRLPADAPELSWPSAQRSVISPFGPRWGRIHEGIDIPMPTATALHAAAAGRVVSAGVVSGYGNYTCIAHAVRLSTCYAHQNAIGVRPGQRVAAGQRIGTSGCTGTCFGPHVHFEVRLGQGLAGTAVDPMAYLQDRPGPSTLTTTGGGSACADTQLASFDGGSLGWPTARRRGDLIGFPYQGTHTLGNWQSDNAVDIAVPVGTPIVAVGDGSICADCGFGALSGDPSSRFGGARFTLTLADNEVFYAHLARVAKGIRPGARIKRGQLLGWSGSANAVAHLHIGFRYGNPRTLLGVGAPTTTT